MANLEVENGEVADVGFTLVVDLLADQWQARRVAEKPGSCG